METLDFPELDTAALAPVATHKLDLATVDLTAVALAKFGDWRKAAADTKTNLTTLVLDLSTPAKCKDARSLRQRLIGEPMAEHRKVAAGIKSKMAQTSKAVGAELEKIEAVYDEADALILPQITKREEALAAEKAKRERIEAERIAKHEAGIAKVRGYLAAAKGLPSERIAGGIKLLEGLTFPAEEWQEFAVPAGNAACETLEALRELHRETVQREEAAAAAEAQRIENARLAAELAEQRRQIEEQRAELARQQQAIADAKAAEELEKRRQEEAAADAAEQERQRAAEAQRQAELIERGRVIVDDIITAEVLRDAMRHEPPYEAKHYGGDIPGLAFAVDRAPAVMDEPLCAPAPVLSDKPAADANARAFVDSITDSRPPIKLGDVNERLGFTMTAAFVIDTLGIKPARTEGVAKLFTERQFVLICAALRSHVGAMAELYVA